MSNKEAILNEIIKPTTARNSMGCNESWYSPYYAIQQVFTKEEIENMPEEEIDNLVKLANAIQDALY